MSYSIVTLINSIPGIEQFSFLELGILDGINHDQILCEDKASVDIRHKPTFKMSTDDFFSVNTRRWDIIYVDALHRVEQAVRDYNNATKYCDKCIIIHDLYPVNQKESETVKFCGDVYKFLYHIHDKLIEYYTLCEDSGMTLFFPPFITFQNIKDTTYHQLVGLNLVRFSIPQLQHILKCKLSR